MIGIYIGFIVYGVYCHFIKKPIATIDYKQIKYNHNTEMQILKDERQILKDKVEKLEKRWF